MPINSSVTIVLLLVISYRGYGQSLGQRQKLEQLAGQYAKKKNIEKALATYRSIITQYYDSQILRIEGQSNLKKRVQTKIDQGQRPSPQMWQHFTQLELGHSILAKRARLQKKASKAQTHQKQAKKIRLIRTLFGKLKKTSFKKKAQWFPKSSSLLKNKQYALRFSTSYSFARQLWLLGDQKRDFTSSELLGQEGHIATRRYFSAAMEFFAGVLPRLQLDGKISYVYTVLKDAPFFNTFEGQSLAHVNEISLAANLSLYRQKSFETHLLLAITHPGKVSEVRPAFLSSNEFSQSLDIGFKNKVDIKKLGLRSAIKLRLPLTGNLSEQLIVDLKGYYQLTPRFKMGPTLYYLNTFEGLDIHSDEFNNQFAQNGVFPLSAKKERALGLGLTSFYRLSQRSFIDLSGSSIVKGENTGREHSFNLGYGLIFY